MASRDEEFKPHTRAELDAIVKDFGAQLSDLNRHRLARLLQEFQQMRLFAPGQPLDEEGPRARLIVERWPASPDRGYGLLEDPSTTTGHPWMCRIVGADMSGDAWSIEMLLDEKLTKDLIEAFAEYLDGKPLSWLRSKIAGKS